MKAALRYAMEQAKCGWGSPASESLDPQGADRKALVQLARAKRYFEEALRGEGAPTSFPDRLLFECALRGLKPYGLGVAIGFHAQDVLDWAKGRARPTHPQMKFVAAIETILEISPGTLSKLAHPSRRTRINGADLPKGSRTQRDALRRLLPDDFATAPDAEKQAMLAKAQELQKKQEQTPRGLLTQQMQNSYRLKIWPEALREEWEELRRQLDNLPAKFGVKDPKRGWKSDGSVDLWTGQFSRFFGFLSSRRDEMKTFDWDDATDDGSLSDEIHNTDNIPVDKLSFLEHLNPVCIEQYLTWLVRRKEQYDRDATLTATDLELLWQLPRFVGARLRSLPKDESKVRAGDLATAKAYVAAARNPSTGRTLFARVGINRRAELAPLLNEDDPLEPVYTMLRAMRDEATELEGVRLAINWRNQCILGIAAQDPLRPRTFSQIPFDAYDAKTQTFNLSPALFKNGASLPGMQLVKLAEREGLFEALTLYSTEGRSILRASQNTNSPSDRFFITEHGGEFGASISGVVYGLTRRYLAQRVGGGITGLTGFGLTAFRHLVATAVLKRSGGDLHAAAAAIRATPQIVFKHYGRYLHDAALNRARSTMEELHHARLAKQMELSWTP